MYNGSWSGKKVAILSLRKTPPTKQFHDTIIVQHVIASLATAGQGTFAKSATVHFCPHGAGFFQTMNA
jgi:hypothetical protein